MVRWAAILGFIFLIAAIALASRPDPWDEAEAKSKRDATLLAEIVAKPDRVGWRISENPPLRRAMIWNAEGERRYPLPGGLAPLAYEFSDAEIRMLTAKQLGTIEALWERFDIEGVELLYCRAEPAICLIYERTVLEETLALRPGSLLSARAVSASTVLFVLAALCCCLALWLWRQRDLSRNSFRLVPERLAVFRGALEITLSPRDLKLLTLLEARDGAVVTKDELYDAGWGRDYMPNSRALDQHMINLRRKLDPDKTRPVLIKTVHGVGYRLLR